MVKKAGRLDHHRMLFPIQHIPLGWCGSGTAGRVAPKTMVERIEF